MTIGELKKLLEPLDDGLVITRPGRSRTARTPPGSVRVERFYINGKPFTVTVTEPGVAAKQVRK
jgi:hypothetical protein